MVRRAVVAALAVLCLRCSAIGLVEAGGAYGVGKERESAAAVEGTLGVGATYEHGGIGPAINARVKAGPHAAQGALGVSVYMLAGPRWVAPHPTGERESTFPHARVFDPGTGPPSFVCFGVAGTSVFQVESVSGQLVVSALSPSAKLGVFVHAPHKEWGFTIAVGGEYDQRLSAAANTGYALLLLGVGGMGYGTAMHVPVYAPSIGMSTQMDAP